MIASKKWGALFLTLLSAGLLQALAQPREDSAPNAENPYLIGRIDGKFPDTIEITRNVLIGQAEGRPLTVNMARPKSAKGLLPAVLFVHGGGWRNGTSKTAGQIAFLAEQGFFGMTVDYRLSGEARWPAQIEDCKYAVRWLRAHAAEYGVDPKRIGVWGTSAGGHLVACLGVMGDEKRLEGSSGYLEQSSAVQAVVDGCGPTDFTKGSDGITGAKEGQSAAVLTELLGGTFEEKPEVWRDASPLAYVKAGEPPFLFIHGELDPVVPIRQAEKLQAALEAAGNKTEFLRIKGGGHGYGAKPGQPPAAPAMPEILQTIADFFKKTLSAEG